ncbi:MAG: response regulator [Nitrospiraceae bacterium]
MNEREKSIEELVRENHSLRTRLDEVTEVLTAIRTGEVDAVVVEGPNGDQVFTLEGADYLYRTFVETINEGAVTLAMDGTIVYCNRRFADLAGILLEQTFGRAFIEFVHAPDRSECEATLAWRPNADIQAEWFLEQPNGTAIPVRISARSLSQNFKNYWCLVVTDLRRQKLHDSLRQSEEHFRNVAGKLEQRVEERDNELILSQERLRALAIEMNWTEHRERKRVATELHDHLAQLLALAVMKLAQVKQKQELASISTNLVNNVQTILADALNYTRTLITDMNPPKIQDVGLPVALNLLVEQMQRHQLTVHFEKSQGEDLKLPEEQGLLLFLSVRELLINVIKHSGVDVVTLSLVKQYGKLRIEVRDGGKGFDIPTQMRCGNSASLGLFSIRERMQALGGSFELESAAEGGTRATLILPLGDSHTIDTESKGWGLELPPSLIRSQPSSGPIQVTHPHHTKGHTPQQPVRVLLVDDHAMVRQGLRSVLDGYSDIAIVGEASNGEEALASVAMHQPAIVVMDINMPKMNGIEATAEIRKRYPEIGVIGLSVQSGGEIQQAILRAGAAVLLNKEAAVEQLYQVIQSVMNGTQTSDMSSTVEAKHDEDPGRPSHRPATMPAANHAGK